MKIGPDGSLCRITSSAKDFFNNVKIVKVPDSEPSYKIQIIRSIDEHEQLSEKSDDEISDVEFFDVKLPSKNSEKEKVVETKVDKPHNSNETVSEGVMRERDRNHCNKPRQYNNKNRYRRRNNSKNYKSLTSMEEMYNYGNRDFNAPPNRDFNAPPNRDFNTPPNRDFNAPLKRDFNLPASHHVAYNTNNYKHTSDDFSPSPWLEPPVMLNYSHAPFSLAHPENPRNSVGLLGDHPLYAPSLSNNQNKFIHDQNSTYTPMAAKFHSKTKNAKFICDQTSPYAPMSSNNHNNNFVPNQSHWNNNYGNYNKNKRNWNQTSRRHQKKGSNQPRNNNYRK